MSGVRYSRARALVTTIIVLPVLGALIAACTDDPAPAEPTRRIQSESSQGCGKTGAPKGVLGSQSVTIKNNPRTYHAIIPEAHDGRTPLPIVFVFHGSGGNGAGMRSVYDLEAEARGRAVFVYPDADQATKTWDLERDGDDNLDMLMFDAMLETLSVSHCIDRKRIFATGYSAGGYFSNQLGCRRGGVLRAIASHAGGGPFGQSDEYGDDGLLRCPERPVAALIAHGADDAEVKLEEAHKSREHWRRVNGCSSGGGIPQDPAPCVALARCAEGRPVVYCEVPGVGHVVWPENGPKVTWAFFNAF